MSQNIQVAMILTPEEVRQGTRYRKIRKDSGATIEIWALSNYVREIAVNGEKCGIVELSPSLKAKRKYP